MNLRVILTVLWTTSLASCASVSSSGQQSEGGRAVHAADVAYSLPRTVLTVTADHGTLTVVKGAEPDPGARFRFQYRQSPLFDDDIVAEVDDNSLLKSVSSTTKDRTGDIVVNLAQVVFTLGTNAYAVHSGRSLPAAAMGAGSFVASYDPFNADDVLRTRPELARAGFCILVGEETRQGSRACGGAWLRTDLSASGNPAERMADRSGVFYRQAASFPVQIYRHQPGGWASVFVGNESFFDKNEVYEVEMQRSLFVEKKVELSFTNGALTKVHINKPSELLSLSAAGLAVVKTIVSIPLEAIKGDTTLEQAQAANVDARTDLIRKQAELLKLQVEQQGSSQRSLVRSDVDFVDAGGRALGGAHAAGNSLEVCQSNLAASVADCQAFVERGAGGF